MTTTVEPKRITLVMRDRTEFYGSKQGRGLGRILDGEKAVGRLPYRPGITIDVERPRLLTQSYKETEGQPMVIRRAKALAHLLDNKHIYILPDERVVGNITAKPSALIDYPELWWRWLDKAIDGDFRTLVSDEERAELHEIHRYWRNYSVHGMERDILPEEVLKYWRYDAHGAFSWLHGGRTGVPNYEKVFELGLKGIKEQAEQRLKEIDSNPATYLDAKNYLGQKFFLKAVVIALEAGMRFGKRYAKLAREMAAAEHNPERKRDLEEVAEVCDWVPENPVRTFHEAVQCFWIIKLIAQILDLQTPGGGERIDQILYPYYKKDKEAGRLTRLQAQELVEHLWLKHNQEGQLRPPAQASGGAGGVTSRVTTIGGLSPDGTDATNEMSYIVLDATTSVRLCEPSVAVRLHHDTSTEFLMALTDALRKFSGVFSIFNDEMMIPYLSHKGIPIQDARLYSTHGCMRWNIPGKAINQRALGGTVVLPKFLEYALFQGWDKFTARQVGYHTPDPATFTSFEDVMKAYVAQARFFLEKQFAIYNLVDVLDSMYLPQPFYSALLDGCIEHGQDCRDYKYYADTLVQPVGQVTCINSLTAIKKLVFDDKKVTMAQLVEALKNNWEGKEELHQVFLKAPKFGNDDPYVDVIARDFMQRNTEVVHSFKNIWGYEHSEDGTGGSSYYNWSGHTGATPDGRRDRELFNDGTVSPSLGTDMKGPTAILKSVGRINHSRTFTHLFNQRFMPQYLEGENREAFASYLRAFVDLGIHHIQFNIVDNQVLEEAQKHPERYGDLVVRVAGYSAYFVDLIKPVQDQIISRTRHGGFC